MNCVTMYVSDELGNKEMPASYCLCCVNAARKCFILVTECREYYNFIIIIIDSQETGHHKVFETVNFQKQLKKTTPHNLLMFTVYLFYFYPWIVQFMNYRLFSASPVS